MRAGPSYYEILGVDRNASTETSAEPTDPWPLLWRRSRARRYVRVGSGRVLATTHTRAGGSGGGSTDRPSRWKACAGGPRAGRW